MSLEAGTRLGPYEVTAQIGKGGMGEVYRARDTSLDRDVAIKVLPAEFASDPERLARFEREAKVLASLNHPNIAHIHGLERSGDAPALILELVEGPTLQDRIAQGAIPLEEALPIAKQIAEALEAAHEQGIIHRDLKPANIKVTPDGVVKVLDFGLAKALEPEVSEADAANSPTMSMTVAATKMGMIMGTAAYMSPEQAKAKPVDKRTDIWAFGVVLFEMLTGRQAFAASDISETLAFVLTREVDLSGVPNDVPASVRRLLRRCLVRDRKNRLADMSMARIEIDEALHPRDPIDRPARPDRPDSFDERDRRGTWRQTLPVALGVSVITALVTALGMWVFQRAPVLPVDVIRLTVDAPTALWLEPTLPDLAISPDGRTLVFAGAEFESGRTVLYMRSIDRLESVVLRGTENVDGPFISPDGQWIGFSAGGEIRKISLRGGAAALITQVPYVLRGASWGQDDQIVIGSPVGGLSRVPAAGGEPEALTSPPAGESHRWPHLLPGGRAVLFSRRVGTLVDGTGELAVLSLDTGEIASLGLAGSYPRYSGTGHLVYAVGESLGTGSTGGSILAVPFDVDRLEVTGTPVPMVDNVVVKGAGAANFDLSSDGRLVYMQGPGLWNAARGLVWVDRAGREEPLDASTGAYFTPDISPDGTRVAVDRADGAERPGRIGRQRSPSRETTSHRGPADRRRQWLPVVVGAI